MKQNAWIVAPGSDESGFRIHQIISGCEWSYPEHSHKGFCEIVCATHGSFRHVINGAPRIQSAGEIILIREKDVHALAGRKFSYVNVMFPPDWLKRLELFIRFDGIADTLLNAPAAPCAKILSAERRSYRRALNRLLMNSVSRSGRRLFADFLLTTVIFRLAPHSDREFPRGLPDWLKRTLAWISENRGNIPSLAQIVKYSCRCHEHFTREFLRHLGMPPSRYLTGARVDRAAEMLVTTNNKLMDVCHAAGFENEGYFFRAFRQRKGMTPGMYRKQYGPRSIQRNQKADTILQS